MAFRNASPAFLLIPCALALCLGAQVRLEPVPKASEQERPQTRIVETVNVVATPVTVTDSAGRFITDLERPDFFVYDNGALQRIMQFELSLAPLSLGIVVDTSSRVEGLLPQVRKAGIVFTQLILGESGEAAVIAYDHRVEVAQDFTANADLVEKALKDLKPGAEQARMSDAVLRALGILRNRPKDRRKVIVVIGEGRDFGSESSVGQALREAQLAGVSVYTVALSTAKALLSRQPTAPSPDPLPPAARPIPPGVPPTSTTAQQAGGQGNLMPLIVELVRAGKQFIFRSDPLKVYAAGTGAVHLSATSQRALDEALEQIGRELHNQYLLAYAPNNLGEEEFHTIDVRVKRSGVQVRARPGYYYIPAARTPTAETEQKNSPPQKKK